MWRHARLIVAVLVVAGLAAVALWPEAVEVDFASAARGAMRVTVDEDGQTRVRDRFVVSAPVAGRVQRIELEPGDPVVRGVTVVARVSPAPAPLLDARTRSELAAAVETARAAVGQARAERERAAAVRDRAETTLRRQQTLAQSAAISGDELDAATASARTARSVLDAATFAVQRAERELQLATARLQTPPSSGRPVDVIAPVNGVVLKRLRQSEAVVPIGEPLLEIGDADCLEVVADLLSTDAVRVAPGNRVLIEQWGGRHTIAGQVRRVEPSGFTKISALGVEEQRVNVVVDFTDVGEAAHALGDGYRVEIRVIVWEQADVIKVPVGSLFRRGDEWALFVVQNGRARVRPVSVGERNSEEAQVTNGLAADEVVVLYPPDTLADGTRVIARQ
ncbi:MAG TPA: efflux RND transporter periplasmic adaptor subunit [Vicinamibacterales bacterium]|nr:efflux RND transporter periplasmic adaptor subunit [Vicinamibacterales bacterium]